MAPKRPLTLLAATAILAACGPPVVDTSSPDDLVASVAEIRDSLEGEELARFDDAFDELTDDALLAGNPESLRSELAACAAVAGMSAAEIIRQAWTNRVEEISGRIAELEALRDESAAARAALSGVEVVEARLYPAAEGILEQPVMEVKLANHTGRRLYRVTFQASLRRRDELEPLVVELVDRPFGTGLAPGKQVTVRVELEYSEWRRVADAAADGIFACSVMTLEDRRGNTIARSDFGAVEEYLLDALGQRAAELEARRPAD